MARKCNRLCHFSSATGECRKPGEADCPAGLPTNEQKIRSADLDQLIGIVAQLFLLGSEMICINAGRCACALDDGREIPDEWCRECAKAWLQQVAEEEYV